MSVLLAVRDGLPWLPQAIGSVLAQTHRELELVVVDDGSSDGSPDCVDGLRDARVVLLASARPEGLATALNRGLARASGEYVARMDADDVAHPDRLRIQLAFLERHRDVGVVGSRIDAIGPDGRPAPGAFDPPAGEAIVAWNLLLFTNPICHPAAVFRRALALEVGGYDAALTTSQDRDLWSRLMLVSRVANVPERLLRYRVHPGSVSATRTAEQRRNSLAIRRRLLQRFLGGEDPGAAIEHWYDAQLGEARIRALRALFLETYENLVRRLDPPASELRVVREDLAQRLDSIRRRDGRVEPRLALRSLLRRFVPPAARNVVRALGLSRSRAP